MPLQSFGFDVITSPEEQEEILARLREQARRSPDEPPPVEHDLGDVVAKE